MLNNARKMRNQKVKEKKKTFCKPIFKKTHITQKRSMTNPNSAQVSPSKFHIKIEDTKNPDDGKDFFEIKKTLIPMSTKIIQEIDTKFTPKAVRLSQLRPDSESHYQEGSQNSYLNMPLTMRMSTGAKSLGKEKMFPTLTITGPTPLTETSKKLQSKISLKRFKSLKQKPFCRKFLNTRIKGKCDRLGIDKCEINKDLMDKFLNNMVENIFIRSKQKKKELNKDGLKL
ncbi:unnamed protein product [Moneuplotes crassus]|uniref:Uncharacterized protein n=1 Tax=Euplotes crassus TaxID=5936 RepID=A0AAD1XCJ0_EUPCR|nr:unnamed protein product [Moneuplotes crassus]